VEAGLQSRRYGAKAPSPDHTNGQKKMALIYCSDFSTSTAITGPKSCLAPPQTACDTYKAINKATETPISIRSPVFVMMPLSCLHGSYQV